MRAPSKEIHALHSATAPPPSSALFSALQSLREDIHAEDTLIASRVTWYVTSQAFLLTAYATSWNAGFAWRTFFHDVLPLAAMVLSVLIFASIYAASWAQQVYIREQTMLVRQIRSGFELSASASLALASYERTMIANRKSASGHVIGGRIHALVRVTPLVLPIGFALLWLYAYRFAPTLAG
ncbi:hypothetical protein [Variovorax sp. N23]|uniref:hypothetical protein n=1 Tax=Variovorax sp. N23 TaxID=2980555 RepID=UPI0021C87E38|nr:hypothetical protein [Variovorax sp. N23]MCU4117691.1 hypothetical protein [Variovorax sp. N23]